MKKILLFVIILVSANFIIPQFGGPGGMNAGGPLGSSGIPRIFTELHSAPSDSGAVIYYCYRIPYNFLIFEKSGSGFKAEYSLGIEITDSITKNIKRAFAERSVYLADFERTNSNKDYEQGVISVELNKGKYHFVPFFTDKSSVKEFRLRPHTIILPCSLALAPVVIEDAPFAENGTQEIELANFNGDIPFSETPYNLVIPVTDTAMKSIKVNIINGRDTVFSGALTESLVSGLKISENKNKVVINSGGKNPTRNFILRGISSKLYEGPVNIIITDTAGKKIASNMINAVWTNKPFSLMNYEFALKALKNIEKPAVIDSLLSLPEEKYQKALFEYWKKYDKTQGTVYNSLLTEFYSRVDYAAINFRTLGNKTGAETDRGKTFIKFGKPSKTDRSSNEQGKIVETWYYDSLGLNFSFIDKSGSGDFTLIKN